MYLKTRQRISQQTQLNVEFTFVSKINFRRIMHFQHHTAQKLATFVQYELLIARNDPKLLKNR